MIKNMDKKRSCIDYDDCQHDENEICETFGVLCKEVSKPKEKIMKIDCEFIELCNHCYNTTTNQIKSYCNDILSLVNSKAYCIVRKQVCDALGR